MIFRFDDKISLRSFEKKNAEEIYAAVKENYEHLRPFLHWVVPEYSIEGAREFIANNIKAAENKERATLGIFNEERIVGAIGFVDFDWSSRSIEIGYWIIKDFEGKGIITKSCRALINYAFEELELNRVEIRCVTENTRSRAVPERLGFKLEGVLRRAMWRHTRLYDLAIYGLLKTD